MKYLPRIVDDEIEESLKIMGAILIEGCKGCGKSTTGKQHAKSILEFQNPDRQNEFKDIRDTRPSLFLAGEKPRMFDEWQMYPVVWDSIRTDVDNTGKKGEYILTGSAKPAEGVTMHTGTSRISRVLMRPMSMYESGDSTGEVSLQDIFDGKDIAATSNLTLEDLADVIVRGGWPAAIGIKGDAKYSIAEKYVDSLIHEEVNKLGNVEHNPGKMEAVLQSLARNISTQVSDITIQNDVREYFDNDVSRPTINDYVNTLEKLFVIENMKATNMNLRSKYAMRTKPKKYFVDPSIATAALGLSPSDLMNDLNTFGLLFESLCMRDLKVYMWKSRSDVTFYRDESGLEVDAILKLNDGRWGAVEIKLGDGRVNEAAESLLKFSNLVDTKKCKKPSFLMVLTGTPSSYKRSDGVYVVSIGTLKD